MIKLLLLVLAGYILYYLKFMDDKFTDMLSLLLIRVIFPALIISKTVTHFSFTEYPYWWILPVSAVVFCLIGILMGTAVLGLLKGFRSRKEFICGCAFQNCGYLPMNLILFSFAGVLRDRLLLFMFLFVMGFNVLMWSLIPLFLSGEMKSKFRVGILLNPPVVATVFSLVWVALFGRDSLPQLVADPLRQMGQAAFPIAMLTLGAYLCRYRAHDLPEKLPFVVCAAVKLLLFPALVLAALIFIPIGPDYRFFLFLQSIMPTAVSLVIIGSFTGADNRFFSGIIFYTHLAAIFSIPLWMAVFHGIVK
ncbi:MAG: AEC family transporter [Candidatus Omnitrophota bacterium]|nr:AEC family transporter [Candidatus Omnitrophota bacterium]